jgi:hypothetical protein
MLFITVCVHSGESIDVAPAMLEKLDGQPHRWKVIGSEWCSRGCDLNGGGGGGL